MNAFFSKYIVSRHEGSLKDDFQEYLKATIVHIVGADRLRWCRVSGFQMAVHDIYGEGSGLHFKVLFRCYVTDGIEKIPMKLDLSYFTSFDNGFGSIERCDWEYDDGMEKLNDYLIPEIDDMDAAAEAILLNVYGEDGIPERIDSIDFARRIGLHVIEGRVAGWPIDAMGAMFFQDVDSLLLLDKGGVLERIPKSTILVNPRVFHERNNGSVNNTIIHECVHYLLHWRVSRFRSIANNSYDGSVVCNVEAGEADDSCTRQIERQATQIAPRILMRRSSFVERAKTLLESYYSTRDEFRSINNIAGAMIDADLVRKYVIPALASDYRVSKLSIKIRMIETGFEIARGVNIYIDEGTIRPFSFAEGSLGSFETFTLSEDSYEKLLKEDEGFRALVATGLFRFVENHVVLCVRQFCEFDNLHDRIVLTDYARSHMHLCALKFGIHRKGSGYSYYSNAMSVMLKLPTVTVNSSLAFLPNNNATVLKVVTVHREKWMSFYKNLKCFAWNERLKAIMKEQEEDVGTLAGKCGVSYTTMQRYLSDKEGHRMTKRVFTHICIILKIPDFISKKLIDESGYLRFDSFNREDNCYIELMTYYYGQDIGYCNEHMRNQGVTPFTDDLPERRERHSRLMNFPNAI